MKRHTANALLLLAASTFASSASATAMFTAEAIVEVAILAISGADPSADIVISGDAFVSFTDEDAFGTGVLSPSVADASFAGDAFFLVTSVAGSASPSMGFAFSEVLTDGFLLFENTSSTETYSIELELDGFATVSASVMDPFIEDALAAALVEISVDFAPIIDIDIVADGLFGPPGDTDSTGIDFAFDVGPLSAVEVTAVADVFGFAAAFGVPEPGTLALLGFAVFGFSRARGTRR